MANIIYRGPLERARLALIAEAVGRAYGSAKFWWISPQSLTRDSMAHASDFMRDQPALSDFEFLDGSYRALLSARSRLTEAVQSSAPLIVVGADALDWARGTGARSLVWCVNGIHEERSLAPGTADRMITRLEWAMSRLGRRPDLTVTVSDQMSAHLSVKARIGRSIAVPCAVDRSTFRQVRPIVSRGAEIAYLGSGAPWQALELTAAVWAAAAERRPDLRFLVASRDQRCDALITAVRDRGRLVGVTDPADVASVLQTARVGTLLRRDHLVNRVSFPTKLGEYLGSGLAVLASDLDWSISDYLGDEGAGALVRPSSSIDEHVDSLLRLVDSDPQVQADATARAAERLSRARWVAVLAEALLQVDRTA